MPKPPDQLESSSRPTIDRFILPFGSLDFGGKKMAREIFAAFEDPDSATKFKLLATSIRPPLDQLVAAITDPSQDDLYALWKQGQLEIYDDFLPKNALKPVIEAILQYLVQKVYPVDSSDSSSIDQNTAVGYLGIHNKPERDKNTPFPDISQKFPLPATPVIIPSRETYEGDTNSRLKIEARFNTTPEFEARRAEEQKQGRINEVVNQLEPQQLTNYLVATADTTWTKPYISRTVTPQTTEETQELIGRLKDVFGDPTPTETDGQTIYQFPPQDHFTLTVNDQPGDRFNIQLIRTPDQIRHTLEVRTGLWYQLIRNELTNRLNNSSAEKPLVLDIADLGSTLSKQILPHLPAATPEYTAKIVSLILELPQPVQQVIDQQVDQWVNRPEDRQPSVDIPVSTEAFPRLQLQKSLIYLHAEWVEAGEESGLIITKLWLADHALSPVNPPGRKKSSRS